MGSWNNWMAATRPKTLPAAVAPVLVGTAEAYRVGLFDGWPVFICLAFALLVQIGTNLANDYFDHVRGADTKDRLGPERLVSSGKIPPKAMLRVAIAVFLAAFLIGLTMVNYRGVEMLAVGILAILFGYAYTGGPYPLAYHGLGDVFVIVFFGLVATMGTFYVISGALSLETFLLGLSLGCLANNILVVNNYRDLETDRAANKRTLVVRLGRAFARKQYAAQLGLAYGCVGLYAGMTQSFGACLALLTFPMGAILAASLRRSEGQSLNLALAKSAKQLMLFSLTLAIGIACIP